MLSAQPISRLMSSGPSTGSGSSPAIRGLSGVWAHRPTASSQAPRSCGGGGGDQLSVVSCPGQTSLPHRPARPRLDLLEPTIRQLLAIISPLTQPRSEAWPERTAALLLTFLDASGRNLEILRRLTPATRHWATQSIHLPDRLPDPHATAAPARPRSSRQPRFELRFKPWHWPQHQPSPCRFAAISVRRPPSRSIDVSHAVKSSLNPACVLNDGPQRSRRYLSHSDK
jgi:hypothetical protein